jgi:tetratricopeptide (TPR) repeat protein
MYQSDRLLHCKGDFQTAKNQSKEAIKLNPQHSRINYELSLIAAAWRKPAKAIRYLEGTIHELREFFELNALLSLAHVELFQKGDMHAKPAHLSASLRYLEITLSLQKRSPNDKELVKVNMTL